jgi:hypothetical protein
MRAGDRFAGSHLLLVRLAFRLKQVPVKDIVNQRRFA